MASIFRSSSPQHKLGHRNQWKRMQAANEIADTVTKLLEKLEVNRVKNTIEMLYKEFVASNNMNYKMGGLLGVAVVIDRIRNHAHYAQMCSVVDLEAIVPPLLEAFGHRDIGVQYHACKALYSIIEATEANIVEYYEPIFDALCCMGDYIVLTQAKVVNQRLMDIMLQCERLRDLFEISVKKHIDNSSPRICTFLISWMDKIISSSEIDIIGFLPTILDGLLNILSDSESEVCNKARSTLYELLQRTETSPSTDSLAIFSATSILIRQASSSNESTRLAAFIWMHELVKIFGKTLVSRYHDMLEVVLPGISDNDEKIRQVARETNEDMHSKAVQYIPNLGTFFADVVEVEKNLFSVMKSLLSCALETTRIGALHWIKTLLAINSDKASLSKALFRPLLNLISSDSSTEELHLVVELLVSTSIGPKNFKLMLESLVKTFHTNIQILNNHGSEIISQLCVHSDAKTVYQQLVEALKKEADYDFVCNMVQVLNCTLLTAPELNGLRALLMRSHTDTGGKDLFLALFSVWCHSPGATISLCFLSQAYYLTVILIMDLDEGDWNSKFLVQIDALIRLLEDPTLFRFRLQLLDSQRNEWLVKALFSLQVVCPQRSEAFQTLQARLSALPPSYVQETQLLDQESQIPNDGHMLSFFRHVKSIRRKLKNKKTQANVQSRPSYQIKYQQNVQSEPKNQENVQSEPKNQENVQSEPKDEENVQSDSGNRSKDQANVQSEPKDQENVQSEAEHKREDQENVQSGPGHMRKDSVSFKEWLKR